MSPTEIDRLLSGALSANVGDIGAHESSLPPRALEVLLILSALGAASLADKVEPSPASAVAGRALMVLRLGRLAETHPDESEEAWAAIRAMIHRVFQEAGR